MRMNASSITRKSPVSGSRESPERNDVCDSDSGGLQHSDESTGPSETGSPCATETRRSLRSTYNMNAIDQIENANENKNENEAENTKEYEPIARRPMLKNNHTRNQVLHG